MVLPKHLLTQLRDIYLLPIFTNQLCFHVSRFKQLAPYFHLAYLQSSDHAGGQERGWDSEASQVTEGAIVVYWPPPLSTASPIYYLHGKYTDNDVTTDSVVTKTLWRQTAGDLATCVALLAYSAGLVTEPLWHRRLNSSTRSSLNLLKRALRRTRGNRFSLRPSPEFADWNLTSVY